MAPKPNRAATAIGKPVLAERAAAPDASKPIGTATITATVMAATA
jgi:hypothetical protein